MLGLTDFLWRLLPGNPILLRVVETGGKRRRDLIIRCAYLGLLILLVLLSLYNADVSTTDLASLAKTSTGVFQNLSYLQLGLVALLAPVFTAGAITQEKDSQTYDILLCTPLSNGQIVLGSLLSRLFFVVILLVSGIPIFSITQIFGGVLIKNIITSFLIAATTAFVTGAMAMAIATFKVGTRRTIFSFYMFIVAYLVGVALLDRIPYFHPVIGHEPDPSNNAVQIPVLATTSWLTGLHPFLALRTIFADKAYLPPDFNALPPDLQSWPTGWYLSSPASFYITAMFTLSMILVLPSIILLRWVAQTNMPFKRWLLAKFKLAKLDRTRKPRTVWANPIAWREAKTKASAAKSGALRYVFVGGGLLGALFLAVRFSTTEDAATYLMPDSFKPATGELVVYTKSEAKHYVVTSATPITFKQNFRDPGRAIKPAELHQRYAVQVDPNVDNTLASVVVMPIPRKLSEQTVRNYLLGAAVLEFAVVLLIVTNAAASAVTREKEDGTLDLLLTTPITSRYYIWGKLRGLVYFVLPLLAVPALSVLIFVLYDLFRFGAGGGGIDDAAKWIAFPETVILMPAMLVIVTAFAAILGMQMSLRLRTTVLAVMSSLGIVVGVCGLLGFCGAKLLDMRDNGGFSLFIGSFSPFTLLTMLINPYDFADNAFRDPDTSGNRLVIAIATVAAVGIYTAVVWGMYKSMVKNFDMTIRRQQR